MQIFQSLGYMRLGGRRATGLMAILAIALHAVLWGAVPMASATTVDPFSVICHSGSSAPAEQGPQAPAPHLGLRSLHALRRRGRAVRYRRQHPRRSVAAGKAASSPTPGGQRGTRWHRQHSPSGPRVLRNTSRRRPASCRTRHDSGCKDFPVSRLSVGGSALWCAPLRHSGPHLRKRKFRKSRSMRCRPT